MFILFALLAAFAPRLALGFVWLFTSYVSRAFNGFLIPLLGFIFLPFTTLIYVLVYSPVTGLTGFDWIWLVLALLLDLGSYGGGAYAKKSKGSKEVEAPKEEKKEEPKKEEKDSK